MRIFSFWTEKMKTPRDIKEIKKKLLYGVVINRLIICPLYRYVTEL